MRDDLDVRRRVRSEFASNVLLNAGAGAGKTEELTRRAAHWLIYGSGGTFDPITRQQGLVMLTFTNAAAAQMGDRLERHLDALTNDEGYRAGAHPGLDGIGLEIIENSGLSRSEIETRARQLLDGAPFRVSTFHSFCLDLIGQYADAAGLPSEIKLETVAERLKLARRRAAWQAVDGALSDGGWLRFDRPVRLDWLVEAIEMLSASPWLPKAKLKELEKALEAEASFSLAQGAEDLAGRLKDIATELVPLLTRSNAPSKLLAILDGDPIAWREVHELIKGLCKQAGLAKNPDKLAAVESCANHVAFLVSWRADFWEFVLPHLERLTLEARHCLLHDGAIGFDDALRQTVEMLQDFPEVRRLASAPISQMMVDEFQDTDPLQVELLHLLHDDEQGHLRPGRLFVVGDPKQSIYSFRGADVEAYRAFSKAMLADGADELRLVRNFRSAPEVLEAVAQGFNSSFGESARMLPADHAGRGRVRLFELAGKPSRATGGAAAYQTEMAAAVAKRLAARLQEQDIGALRDCAVLVPTRAEATKMTAALRQFGVHALLVGSKDRYGSAPSQDLLNLLAFVCGAADDSAIFGLLQGPLIGLEPATLVEAKANGLITALGNDQGALQGFDLTPMPTITRLLALRRHFAEMDYSRFLAALDEDGWCPGPWSGCSQTAANQMAIVDEFIEAWEDCDVDIRQWLAEQRQQPDAPAVTLPNDAVVVATQHSAKGLEWPLVVAVSLKARRSQNPSEGLFHHQGRLAIKLPSGASLGRFHELVSEADRSRDEEAMRLAYVACTRAKRELWLVSPDGGGCLHTVSKRMGTGLESVERCADRPTGTPQPASVPRRFQQADSVWRARLRPGTVSPSQIGGDDGERIGRDDDSPAQTANPYATSLGELVHLVLELSELDQPLEPQLGERLAEAVERMKDQLPTDQSGAIVQEAAALLSNLAQSELWASMAEFEVVQKELPFTCPGPWVDPDSSAEVGTGFIDLIYRKPCGSYVLADWKVTSKTDHEALVEHYRPQLRAYARVLKPLVGDHQLEAELLLVRTAERLAVPLPLSQG